MDPWLTLIPAYGRDYQTAEAVLADWLRYKDFRLADVSCRWDGAYLGRREGEMNEELKGCTFKIRYNKHQDFALLYRDEQGQWLLKKDEEEEDGQREEVQQDQVPDHPQAVPGDGDAPPDPTGHHGAESGGHAQGVQR